MARVRQQQACKIESAVRAVDFAAEPLFDEAWNVACVIEVSVRQHQQPNAFGIDLQWAPIAQPQFLRTLKRAAVEHQSLAARFEHVSRARDSSRSAEEG